MEEFFKNYFISIIHPNRVGYSEIQKKMKNIFQPHLYFFVGSASPSSLLPPPWEPQGDGECGLWSVFLLLSPPVLHQHGVSPTVKSLSWASEIWVLLTGLSSLINAPAVVWFSWGTVLQWWIVPMRIPLQATFPDTKPTPSWDLHRVEILHGMSICSRMGSSMDCSVDICSSVDLHVMVLSYCRGNSVPAAGAPPPPHSSLPLVSTGLTHILPLVS